MTAIHRLKHALTEWRKAERQYADAVFRSGHPDTLIELRIAQADALAELRSIVDSEPWSDIAQGL